MDSEVGGFFGGFAAHGFGYLVPSRSYAVGVASSCQGRTPASWNRDIRTAHRVMAWDSRAREAVAVDVARSKDGKSATLTNDKCLCDEHDSLGSKSERVGVGDARGWALPLPRSAFQTRQQHPGGLPRPALDGVPLGDPRCPASLDLPPAWKPLRMRPGP